MNYEALTRLRQCKTELAASSRVRSWPTPPVLWSILARGKQEVPTSSGGDSWPLTRTDNHDLPSKPSARLAGQHPMATDTRPTMTPAQMRVAKVVVVQTARFTRSVPSIASQSRFAAGLILQSTASGFGHALGAPAPQCRCGPVAATSLGVSGTAVAVASRQGCLPRGHRQSPFRIRGT